MNTKTPSIHGFIDYFPPVFIDYLSKYYSIPLKNKENTYTSFLNYTQQLSENKKFILNYDIK